MIERLRHLVEKAMLGSAFMKAVATLLSGTVVAITIAYLAQPILTRLYTPEAFGLFDTFVALVAIFIPFASLRYEDAIMLPEDDERAFGILGLTLLLVVLVAGLSAVLSMAAKNLNMLSAYPGLVQCLIWIPPTLIAVRFAKLTELWLTRKKSYPTISAGQVAQTGTMATLRIALSKVTASNMPFGLIWGYIAGHVVSTLWYASKIVQSQPGLFRFLGNKTNIREAIFRYRQFPKFSMPSTLLNTLQSRLPFILFLFFFGEATVGYFGRAFALFAVPLSLIGGAISQVFFVEGTIANRGDSLAILTSKVHSSLVTVGLFPTFAIMLTGPEVFGFVLGANWTPAGEYLVWLAPWFFFASIASPLTRIFDILEKQRTDFQTSIVIFLVQMSLLIIGCLTGEVLLTLIFLSVGGVIARIIHISTMLKLAGVSFGTATSHYLNQVKVALPFLIGLAIIQYLSIPWLTTLALAITGIGFLFMVYKKTMEEASGL